MTLQADINAQLPFLRAQALSRMESVVTVYRDTGNVAQDEETGSELPAWDDIYTDAPFRLGGADRGSAGVRTVDTPGGEVTLAVRTGHFPHTFADLRDGDLIDVTAGECAGLVLRIVEATWQDQATARRVQVVEIDRPEGWA